MARIVVSIRNESGRSEPPMHKGDASAVIDHEVRRLERWIDTLDSC